MIPDEVAEGLREGLRLIRDGVCETCGRWARGGVTPSDSSCGEKRCVWAPVDAQLVAARTLANDLSTQGA